MDSPTGKESFQETAVQRNETAFDWLHQFSPYGVFTTDNRLRITGWNQWMVFHTKLEQQSVLGRNLLDLYPDLAGRKMDRYFRAVLLGQTAIISHGLHKYLIFMKPGSGRDEFTYMPQSAIIAPLSAEERVLGTITYIENVVDRIQRERELEERVAQLEEALREVKTLRGMLPICSYCKKIRDDKGYWNNVENYLGSHSELEFSHGICPECAQKHFPEYDLYGDE